MASWSDIEQQAPELAALARERLDAFVHKTLATTRRDGSPRISGSEAFFAGDDLWFGSMWGGVKARDLQRDPRFALHSGSADPGEGWTGDAKVAGRVEEITDPDVMAAVLGAKKRPDSMHLFRADISELVTISLPDPPTHLLIESWHEGRGISRLERK
jgi:hypothetical protein